MIDGMFSIMARINDIRSRFGIVPPSAKDKSQAEPGFSRMVDQSNRDKNIPLLHSDRPVSKGEIEDIISFYSGEKGVSPDLVKALVKSGSDYNNEAVSPDGALGLMQLMPSIADRLGITDPFNPEENVKGGINLLSDLLESNKGDYIKALEAYRSAGNDNDSAVKSKSGEYAKKVIDFYISDDK